MLDALKVWLIIEIPIDEYNSIYLCFLNSFQSSNATYQMQITILGWKDLKFRNMFFKNVHRDIQLISVK